MVTKYTYDDHLNTPEILEKLRIGTSLILIKNFPVFDADFQSLIKHLGTSVKEPRNNNGKDVFDVKVKKQNGFFTSIANSNLNFPLHTDCADFKPFPIALDYCVYNLLPILKE